MTSVQCRLPIYMLNDLNIVQKCAKSDGNIIAGVLIFIISIGMIMWLVSKKNKNKKKNEYEEKDSFMSYIVIVVLWIVLAALIIWLAPAMLIAYKTSRFQENELMIDNLVQGGMTKQNARKEVISQRKSEAAAKAIRDAANRQARSRERQTDRLTNAINRRRY